MTEPIWLRRAWVDALNFQQLKRFGGLNGVRDTGAIESALARARNRWEVGSERDIAGLAAAYGYGLTRSRGYSDANKRIGFMAMAVFLEIHGVSLHAPEEDVVTTMLGGAAGGATEEGTDRMGTPPRSFSWTVITNSRDLSSPPFFPGDFFRTG